MPKLVTVPSPRGGGMVRTIEPWIVRPVWPDCGETLHYTGTAQFLKIGYRVGLVTSDFDHNIMRGITPSMGHAY